MGTVQPFRRPLKVHDRPKMLRPRPGPRRVKALLSAVVLCLPLLSATAWGLVPPLLGCGIKGNISRVTGERIYHVPGQSYYRGTFLNPLAGERWFCSEKDAIAAGWRRSLT